MISFLLLFSALAFALLGCGYLALSQSKHGKAVFGRDGKQISVKVARILGWLLLGVSYLICVVRDGFGFALLLWPLVVAVALFMIVLVLAYRPSGLRFLSFGR